MPTPHHSAPNPPTSGYQAITNESWPPDNGARTAQDRPAIDARARIVWERDGEEWIEGTVTRWHGQHVFFRFNDPRAQLPFMWLRAEDVERR